MGLLDSDAEELKRNKTGENTSGRKVNQSGLGALKGLSKYSNLTAKYRTTGKEENASDAKSVEHLRGTSSKSVQSQGEVRAENVAATTSSEEIKVSANSVQSQCATPIIDSTPAEQAVESKSVQSRCSELADLLVPEVVNETKSLLSETFEVSAKSVQEKNFSAPLEIQIQHEEILEPQNNSVQSQCAIESLKGEIVYKDSIVSAKSVQHDALINDIRPVAEVPLDDLLEYESPCKVSAEGELRSEISVLIEKNEQENFEITKSVQSECKVSASAVVTEPLKEFAKVSANSVQSQCDDVAPSLPKEKIKVRAKSVQSQGEVGAAPSTSEPDTLSFKVSAKSVQSGGEVRADDLEDTEIANSGKSKVIVKNPDISEPTESIISIAGSQRVIVDFLFQLCLWNNSLVTPPITKQQLTSETGLLEETALSSIKRLRKKNIIDRHAYKDGKAGWTQYQFSESSYKELLHLRQVGAKSVQPLNTSTMVPKKGMSHFNLNDNKQGLIEQSWFKNLDFSKIHPIGPMMVNPAIRSLVEEKLAPELVQDFINRFTSWTSTQGRITSPIGLFCDKLKELAREGDSPIFGCMTEEERQVEVAFVAQVEKAKAEMELIRKARSEVAEKEADTAFESWYNSSSNSEKFELAETSAFAPAESEAYKRILKAAFFQKVSL